MKTRAGSNLYGNRKGKEFSLLSCRFGSQPNNDLSESSGEHHIARFPACPPMWLNAGVADCRGDHRASSSRNFGSSRRMAATPAAWASSTREKSRQPRCCTSGSRMMSAFRRHEDDAFPRLFEPLSASVPPADTTTPRTQLPLKSEAASVGTKPRDASIGKQALTLMLDRREQSGKAQVARMAVSIDPLAKTWAAPDSRSVATIAVGMESSSRRVERNHSRAQTGRCGRSDFLARHSAPRNRKS